LDGLGSLDNCLRAVWPVDEVADLVCFEVEAIFQKMISADGKESEE
jgi:hypothetical protein